MFFSLQWYIIYTHLQKASIAHLHLYLLWLPNDNTCITVCMYFKCQSGCISVLTAIWQYAHLRLYLFLWQMAKEYANFDCGMTICTSACIANLTAIWQCANLCIIWLLWQYAHLHAHLLWLQCHYANLHVCLLWFYFDFISVCTYIYFDGNDNKSICLYIYFDCNDIMLICIYMYIVLIEMRTCSAACISCLSVICPSALRFTLIAIWQSTNMHVIWGGGRVVRWCWVNFQCRGVLQFGFQ